MIAESAVTWEFFADRLLEEFREWWERTPEMESAEAVEAFLQEQLRRVGQEALQTLCQRGVAHHEQAETPRCCEHRMDYHSRRPRTVLTLFGQVRVVRRYYRCLHCGKSVSPADAWLGWRGGFSYHLQEAVAWECARVPYREALASVRKFLGIELSVHGAEQIVAEWGAEPLVPKPYAERVKQDLIVQLDGTTAHLEEGWKEVKLAALYAWDHTDPEATEQARSYCADWLPAADFTAPLWREAVARGAPSARQVVVIGDGAEWVWQTASLLFPRALQILDWYHLTEHVNGAAKAAFGSAWEEHAERWRSEVWEGRSEGVQEHMRELTAVGRDDADGTVRKCAQYLETHQQRTRYADFRAAGWPVGSGVVEGGCKHVINMRFKRKSTRWTKRGAEAVLWLRIDWLNGRWSARCKHLRRAA